MEKLLAWLLGLALGSRLKVFEWPRSRQDLWRRVIVHDFIPGRSPSETTCCDQLLDLRIAALRPEIVSAHPCRNRDAMGGSEVKERG